MLHRWLCEWMRVTQTWACSREAVGALLAKCNVRAHARASQTHSGRLANGAHEMPTIVPSKTYSTSAVRPRLTRWPNAMARR
jgi:hypothetical protein